jgi:hypothetical protein
MKTDNYKYNAQYAEHSVSLLVKQLLSFFETQRFIQEPTTGPCP